MHLIAIVNCPGISECPTDTQELLVLLANVMWMLLLMATRYITHWMSYIKWLPSQVMLLPVRQIS